MAKSSDCHIERSRDISRHCEEGDERFLHFGRDDKGLKCAK
jgi:hypothetical protein